MGLPDVPASAQPTTIWLARHAEAHNPHQILYGRLPRVDLSPEGRRQAGRLADFLVGHPISTIYTSPMLRARRTAEAVHRRRPEVPLRTARDLNEVRTSWQGHPSSALDQIGWDFYAHARTDGDESIAAIRDRMRRWVRRVLRRHAGEHVLGVTHGDPLLILVTDLQRQQLDLASIRPSSYPPPATVFRLDFDGGGRLDGACMHVPHQQAAA